MQQGKVKKSAGKLSKQKESLLAFDAWRFCKEGGLLSHLQCKFEFPRLGAHDQVLSCDVDEWQVVGRVNTNSDCVIHLYGRVLASFGCVACGKPVSETFEFSRCLILKTSEAEAELCEDYLEQDDVDVISCSGVVNLRDWIEDEVLLSFPMFPRHGQCDISEIQDQLAQINATLQDDSAEGVVKDKQRPFANLAGLLKPREQ